MLLPEIASGWPKGHGELNMTESNTLQPCPGHGAGAWMMLRQDPLALAARIERHGTTPGAAAVPLFLPALSRLEP
jgi:hypothetical protein